MWRRYPHIDTSPHIGDPDVITTTTTVHLQPLYHRTTLLPDLHLQLQGKRTQLTSTASPDITTPTGRIFITNQSSKRLCVFPRKLIPQRRSWLTMTTAWLMALPSSLTDDCLLASTWDYAGTTRHATPRRRTPTTSFQHLWCKHRSTARETSPRHHCLNTPWHACRTTSTVHFNLFTPASVPPSSSSPLNRPRIPAITSTSAQASTPSNNLRGECCGILSHGDVATSHKAMVSSHWQRRRLQWRHQAQERSYAPVGQ
jgi:hypothetical protein